MAHDIANRTVLITGGGRGVGAGITRTFLAAGADVVICGRTEPEQLFTHAGRSAAFERADVRDPEQVKRLIDAVVARTGRLDVVVNNAGGSPPAEAATSSPRFASRIIELNLLGPLYVSQAAYPLLREAPGGGAIVMVGSVSGLRPSPGTAVYGAAKAGLHQLAASLAVEWAPDIRVNTVAAGIVRTELAPMHYGDEAGQAAVAATVPLGRMAEPDDIGEACLWLASPAAGYVTGATLVLHGGGERPAFLAAAESGAGAEGHAP